MAKPEVIVGLDVGTTKVCAVVGEITKNGVDLTGHGIAPCQGLKKGMVVDIDATAQAIEEAVDKAQQVTGLSIRSVVVGVTGDHIQSVNNKGSVTIQRFRDITEEDVEQALEAAQQIDLEPGREIIHSIPRDFSIDGRHGIRHPVGMSGATLDVEAHVVTAQTSFIQNVIKCVHQADLAIMPGGIILEPLATAEAVLHGDEKEMGVVLVDIGGGTSDVALFRAGSALYSAVIPVGGNHVTNDMAVGLRISRAEAERVKLKHGIALGESVGDMEAVSVTPLGHGPKDEIRIPRKIIAEIVQPRMEELFELVQAEIGKAGALDGLPAGLVLSGGGSLLPGTREVATQVLGLPVRLGSALHPAANTGELRGPACATGVGLVMYAARHRHAAQGREESLFGAAAARIRRWLRRLFS